MLSKKNEERLTEAVLAVKRSNERRFPEGPEELVLRACRSELRLYTADSLKAIEEQDILNEEELENVRRQINSQIARIFQATFDEPF